MPYKIVWLLVVRNTDLIKIIIFVKSIIWLDVDRHQY